MKPKIPKRRAGFYYRDNDITKPYVSVTKVLKETIAKPYLREWYAKEAVKEALKDPSLSIEDIMVNLKVTLREAQERGRAVHQVIEILASGGPYIPDKRYEGYCQGAKNWWDKTKPEVISSEMEVYCEEYKYAGRCDLIYKLNNEKWLLDIKTGKNIYREVGVQLAAYKYALKEQIKIDNTGVLLLKEDGNFQFATTNDTIEDFLNILKVWQWANRKGG